jgi:hypothetical protein
VAVSFCKCTRNAPCGARLIKIKKLILNLQSLRCVARVFKTYSPVSADMALARTAIYAMLLLLVCATPARGYQEEFIDVQPSGFHMTSVAHEVETNQIVINVTISAGQNSVPLMFLSKEGSAASTLDILQHPCEGSANDDDVCCLNALASDYQLAPDMQGLYNNSRVCPWDGNAGAFVRNMSENSLYNPELSVRLPPGAIANSEFLSTGRQYWMENMSNTTENVWFTCYEPCPVEEAAGSDGNATNATTNATSRRLLQASNDTSNVSQTSNEVADVSYCHVLCTPDANGSFANGTNFTEHRENVTTNWQEPRSRLLYPEQVSYTVLSQDGDSFDLELRLTHAYLMPRAKHTDLGSGLSKYEFTLGATFVELLSHTTSVSITSAQTTLDYFKTEFVFLSISSEQARTPLDTLGVEIHQATSASDGGQYQWILLDADYDRVRYPGVATIKPDSLRWARVPTLADATGAAWQYPCRAGDGYYYADAAGMTALADVAQQTDCLPDVPLWCRFNTDEDFFLPLPTSSAMSGGYISGPDTTTNIYLSGVLELTDGNGFKHLSTFFVSIDLDGYPVLAHCKDQTFKYNDVSDAIAITARVGVKPESESAVRLDQTITQNRNLNELVASSAPTGRRLLSVEGKEVEVDAEPEFVREGRRLLQSSDENACAEPVCGFQEGVDVNEPCQESLMPGGKQFRTYQCRRCDSIIFDPFGYNNTYLHCQFGTCTIQQADGTWKFITRDNTWRRAPAYDLRTGLSGYDALANGNNFRFGQHSMNWILPWLGRPCGGESVNYQYRYDHDVYWVDRTRQVHFPTPKITKSLGFFKQVAIMPDNTIRRWGRNLDSPKTMSYSSVHGSTRSSIGTQSYSMKAYFGDDEAIVPFPHNATENIIQLATSANYGKFMILTNKNNIYFCDQQYFLCNSNWNKDLFCPNPSPDCSLSTPLDTGTTKRISHISGNAYGFHIVFDDGTVKAMFGRSDRVQRFNVRASAFASYASPVHGLAGIAGAPLEGYDAATLKDAPFIPDLKVRIMKDQGSTSNGFIGNQHQCAIRQDNNLICWGDNQYGQLGRSDTLSRATGEVVVSNSYPWSITYPWSAIANPVEEGVRTASEERAGATYGNGLYTTSWSSGNNVNAVWRQDWWTCKSSAQGGAGNCNGARSWGSNNYYPNGVYNGEETFDGTYKGDWITMRFPQKMAFNRLYTLHGGKYGSSAYYGLGDFRVYARNDGGPWNLIFHQNDPSWVWCTTNCQQMDNGPRNRNDNDNGPQHYTHYLPPPKEAYQEWGIICNKLFYQRSGNANPAPANEPWKHTLKMVSLTFYGDEMPNIRELFEPLSSIPPIDFGLTETGEQIRIVDYAVGSGFTCALTHEYKVKCWGRNNVGQLGYFDDVQRGHSPEFAVKDIPYLNFGNRSVTQITATDSNAIAVFDDRFIQSWGQCANRFPTHSSLPCSCCNVGSSDTCATSFESFAAATLFDKFPGGKPARGKAARCGSLRIASVKTKAELPLTVETFTETLQEEYVSTVAIVAGVSDDQVEIVSITSTGARRRLLQESGIEVETEITDDGSNSLSSIEEQLTTDNINNFLQTNPASSLPPITLGALETVEEVVEGTTFDFIGASSYAEAAISLELDAVTFMQIPYAANYKLRIDSMLVFNFLGVGHFEVIRNLIRAGTGFNMTRDGTDLYYTLTPNFGNQVVCDQVTSTVSIAPSQFSCFWRRAIADNVVSPEASESLYYYRQGGDADVANAKEWIRDTLLGGDHGFANDTAAEYFQRSCSRNNDTAAEPRSYACLYVDPGYRL